MSEPAQNQRPAETVSPATHEISLNAVDGNCSDYGDFGTEEELWQLEEILTQFDAQRVEQQLAVTDIEDYEPPQGVRLPKILGVEQTPRPWEAQNPLARPDQVTIDIHDQYTEKRAETPDDDTVKEPSVQPQDRPTEPDTRSPLERFRKPPKKGLSVTDLISPAWCELQYFYTLSKHGRKRRTPAMRQGTAVHQALEDEVHTTVPVEITKKEDSWGLRIFNVIQGLRTLRETGRTRELEIWGTIGGEIVNGVIDELSSDCPDPAAETEISGASESKVESMLPEYQTSIIDYLTVGSRAQGQNISEALSSASQAPTRRPSGKEQRVYITDVKTRASPTLPTDSSVRPTVLQLHLYHHMLENLAQGNFFLIQLADRYGLNVNETFSDSFLAQIGSLNQDLFDTFSSTPELSAQIASSQNSMDILLRHNNLSSLWDFMILQFRETFLLPSRSANATPTSTPQSVSDLPSPQTQPTRLSPLLTAEYLAPNYKHAAGTPKKSIGRKSFVFSPNFLKAYLEDNLAWWRGEREARGVELQEAWKCRSCDFRDDCEWIHERDNAALQEALERRKMRQVAGVEGKSDQKTNAAGGAIGLGAKSKV